MKTEQGIAVLQKELDWFQKLLELRLELCMGNHEQDFDNLAQIPLPDLSQNNSLYAETICKHHMGWQERAVLALALAAQLNPSLLDVFLIKSERTQSFFSVFGGIVVNNNSRFIPTMQTGLFMLGGLELTENIKAQLLFDPDHYLYTHGLLIYPHIPDTEPAFSRILSLTPEFFRLITSGKILKPEFNSNFPAKRIYTELDWDDLVLNYDTHEALDELKAWLKHGADLMKDSELRKKIKKGYRCLFYGPPGTGKTLTACLLGKSEAIDVYRIDLSQIVSKYIGETEKNLKNIFVDRFSIAFSIVHKVVN